MQIFIYGDLCTYICLLTKYLHCTGELFAVGAFNTLRLCDKTGVR